VVTDDPPASIVAVMAHPDDAELWAGGTLALHAAAGATVTVIIPRHDDETRNDEAARSAEILGVDLHQPDVLTVAWLGDALIELRPDVVVTHPLRDVHPGHHDAAAVVVGALPGAVVTCGHPRRAYTCDSYNNLTLDGPVPAHTIIDITATFDTKMRALATHTSQPIDQRYRPMADTLTRLWGARAGVARAEAFTPLPILGRLLPSSHFL
jgi:LmbE family N-acetylglucosaminyl deacetylase